LSAPPKINDVRIGLGHQGLAPEFMQPAKQPRRPVGGLGKADFLLAGAFKPNFAPCDADFASKPGGLVHHIANAHPPGTGPNCLAGFCRQFERRKSNEQLFLSTLILYDARKQRHLMRKRTIQAEKEVTDMHWSPMPFGKYEGRTLPEIIIRDADWFFWVLPKLYGKLANWRVRHGLLKFQSGMESIWKLNIGLERSTGFVGLGSSKLGLSVGNGQ
jgi:hypothetical protein